MTDPDLTQIPPGSFVIIRTKIPSKILFNESSLRYFKENQILGVVLTPDESIEVWTDRELATIGLRRVEERVVQ